MRNDKPLHILMRFSDKFGPAVGTIKAHQDMIVSKGTVWLAKGGRPLARKHIATINQQLKNGIPTYLYLVQRVRDKYDLYCAHVLLMAREFPIAEKFLVPPYYTGNFLLDANLWVKLSVIEPSPTNELEKLVLQNTATPAKSSLMYSMAGLFLVRHTTTRF
jgi:hypothetical protein